MVSFAADLGKKLLLGIGALALVLLVVAWARLALTFEPVAEAESGEVTSDLREFLAQSFPSTSGRTLELGRLEARALVIDFWATWCAPCHVQAEVLRELYPEAQARGAEFIGIALGEDRQVVESFLAKNPLPYPVIFDSDSRSEDYISVPGLPKILVLDREGRKLFERTGIVDRSTLKRVLDRALQS